MAGNPADLDERLAALGKAIEAARTELASKQGFENQEIGDILKVINEDFEAVTHEDHAKAHETYDKLEYRLGELQEMLGALPR